MSTILKEDKKKLIDSIWLWWNETYNQCGFSEKVPSNIMHDQIVKLADKIITFEPFPQSPTGTPTQKIRVNIKKQLDFVLFKIDVEKFHGLDLDIRKVTPDTWGEDYGIFRIHDIKNRPYSSGDDTEYSGFREDEVWCDIQKHIRDAFKIDDTINVEYFRDAKEFEITRKTVTA